MSLFDTAERFASIDRSQVLLDTERCLHAQDQYSDCTACYAICPAGAISEGRSPSFDSENCQSCFACLPVCSVGAYRADDDVSSLLNCVTHIEDQPVELLCGLHPHPEKGADPDAIGIQIHACLAGLGSGAYVTLSALGVARLILRTDACAACKWHSLSPQIHRQIEKANLFLSAWEKKTAITCLDNIEVPVERPLWNAKNPPLSRRDLFRMMAKQGKVAVARAMEKGISTTKRQPGRDRLRLLSAVSHLPEPTSSINLREFGFATLSVSDSCTACGACGRACPTEALRFEKNDEEMTYTLSFSAQKCIACDLCDHVCLPDAITLDHAPALQQVFEAEEPEIVGSGSLVQCERCKSLMAAREGMKLCPLCEYRRSHPFGSMIPKKIKKGSQA